MVQNAVMRQQPILYEFVIGHLFHRRWHEFISQYTDIFTLVPIKNDQSSNTEYRWRLYQSKHREQWEMVDTERTAAWQRFEERVQAAIVWLLSTCPQQSCHMRAIAWHITPLLVYEGQHHPLRPHRLLQMLDTRSDLFTIEMEPNGAIIINLT